jgi:GT2 family glycosyltransferase
MLDIVIPTYNQTEKTLLCFSSIMEHTKKYRIIWVDNGSDESHIREISSFLEGNKISHQKILLQENLGFIKATNAGMAVSSGRYLCLLNNDTEVTANWAWKMASPLERNMSLGLIGPVSSADGSWQGVNNIGKHLNIVMPSGWDGPPDVYNEILESSPLNGRVEYQKRMIAFFCVMMRRSLVKEIGYLDERFGMGFGDDDDYCKRVLYANFKIAIALDTYIYHAHRTTFKSAYQERQIKAMQDANLEILNLKWKMIGG